VDVLLKRLRFPEGQRISVVLTGGLFHRESPLIKMISARLHDRAEVVADGAPSRRRLGDAWPFSSPVTRRRTP